MNTNTNTGTHSSNTNHCVQVQNMSRQCQLRKHEKELEFMHIVTMTYIASCEDYKGERCTKACTKSKKHVFSLTLSLFTNFKHVFGCCTFVCYHSLPIARRKRRMDSSWKKPLIVTTKKKDASCYSSYWISKRLLRIHYAQSKKLLKR